MVRPLNLGGVSASGGGSGGPPGGYIGVLPQTSVGADYSEIADNAWCTTSGYVDSLLDNLNHLRYRLQLLEAGGAVWELIVQEDGATVLSGVEIINFENAEVTDDGGGTVTVTCSGGGSGNDQMYGEDLTDQVPQIAEAFYIVDNTFVADTLRVYYNGLRQKNTNYTEETSLSGTAVAGFWLHFETITGDELAVDYEY